MKYLKSLTLASLYIASHFCGPMAHALNSNSDLFMKSTPIIGTEAQRANFAGFTQLAARHLHLFSMLPTSQSAASSVVLLPTESDPGADPGFLPESQVLMMGPLAECPRSPDVDFTAINLHEYAHSVFTPNFYHVMAIAGEAPLSDRYDAINARTHSQDELTKRVTLRDLVAPFEEVFADTFAVIALNNPHALQVPLKVCGTDDVLRDFSVLYQVRGWDEGSLKPLSLTLNSGNVFNKAETTHFNINAKIHNVLSPFRSVIWQKYLELQKRNPSKAGEIIVAATFEASIRVVKQLNAKQMSFSEWFQISKESLNSAVIREFKNMLNSKR